MNWQCAQPPSKLVAANHNAIAIHCNVADDAQVKADSVLECVGTQESMMQAINSSRKGGYVSYVGVPHGVELDGEQLFFSHVHLHGGPAPMRRYLPDLIRLVLDKKINPGKVCDLILPLDRVAEGYRAMHERRAIKTLLRPNGTK